MGVRHQRAIREELEREARDLLEVQRLSCPEILAVDPAKRRKLLIRRRAGLRDFWEFSTQVLANEALDPFFHRAISRVVMHGEAPTLVPGDYYFPSRKDLVKDGCRFGERGRLSKYEDSPRLYERLRTPPTAMDGRFRGMYVRVAPYELAEMTIIMIPRGHLKTTFLTVGKNLWHVIRDPRTTELIVMNSQSNVRNIIKEMRMFFEASDTFRETFPELVPAFLKEGQLRGNRTADLRWKADMFDVRDPANEGKTGLREATVTGRAIGSRSTSLHAVYLHFDDLVDEKVIRSQESIQQNIIDFQQMLSLATGDVSKFFYVGTPWHYSDLSQWLLNEKISGLKHCNVVIATVLGDDDEPFFPKGEPTSRGHHPGFTVRAVERRRSKTERAGLFSSQYLMQPVDAREQSFLPSWYKFYRALPKGRSFCTVCTIDPSISASKQGDYTAFLIVTLDHMGNWFVREGLRFRSLGVPYIISQTYDVWEKYGIENLGGGEVIRLECFGYEAIGFQRTILTIFNDLWARGEREVLPIFPVEPSRQASKEWRIKRVTNLLKMGRVFLPAGDPDGELDMHHQRPYLSEGLEALVEEGERFPLGRHDDMLDALSMVMDLPFYPEPPEQQESETLVARVRRGFKKSDDLEYVDDVCGIFY